MKWICKAALQKLISFLPAAHRINYLFHRYVTVGPSLSDHFVLDKFNHTRKHLQAAAPQPGFAPGSLRVLEIGTGWYPLVPISLFLSGVDDIVTADIRRLYSNMSVNQSLDAILRFYHSGRLKQELPGFIEERIRAIEKARQATSLREKFQLLHITGLTGNISKIPLSSGSLNLVVSNNTLQFIETGKLSNVLNELMRLLQPDGTMSLAIDLSDEFSHADPSISHYNFYRYSDVYWKMITNRLSSAQRNTYPQYRSLFTETGLAVRREELERGNPEDLESVPIHKRFWGYNREDLLVLHAYFILDKNHGYEESTDPELPPH